MNLCYEHFCSRDFSVLENLFALSWAEWALVDFILVTLDTDSRAFFNRRKSLMLVVDNLRACRGKEASSVNRVAHIARRFRDLDRLDIAVQFSH